jgi:thiol-disulfide isomerase/thioredoxin
MIYPFQPPKGSFEFYSEFDNAEHAWAADVTREWQGETSEKPFDPFLFWVQQSLNKITKGRLAEDGQWGGQTRNALNLFRRQQGLKASDEIVVCPATERALIGAGADPPPPTVEVPGRETTPPSLSLYVDIPLQILLGKAKSMTGIFVPENYCPQSQVDLIVFLHGNKVRVHKPHFSIDSFWNLPTFRLREEVNKSQKNVILIAPTLGQFNEPGSLVCSGGFDRFLDQVMFSLKQFGPYKGTNKPTIGNIILACHSGSGWVMRSIATGTDIAATKIQECWAFEPSASIGSANQWKTWVQSRATSKLYVYYLAGNAGQVLCNNMDRRLRGSQVGCTLVDRKLVPHDEIPVRFLKDRIQAASFLALKSSCTAKPTPTPGKMSFLPNRWPFGKMPLSFSRESSPVELESNFEYEGPATVRTTRQIYASQSKVKPAVDANFWSIFSDRNKVVVIAFWADSCAPCAEAAAAMTAVADRYSKGLTGPVKFYHVQWDPRVNPRIHKQFGFRSVPVVFFYYTGTGRPPYRTAPLLEGSLGHDEKHDPNRYARTIEAILRRHAPAKVRSVSERRGWKRSTDLVSKSDFGDIDQLLVEPSPFQPYLSGQYRANPGVRLSKLGIIQIKNTYDSTYQTVNGRPPGPDNAGTFDKKNLKLYLLSVNIQFQTYLGRAIHEAIHMFCCPVKGATTNFHNNYGFGITEGFTQYITEEILKSQKLTIIQPSPYGYELAAVRRLIRVVGVQALAEDYFLCKRRLFEQLHKINKYSEFWRLSRDADQQREQGSERGMIEAYQKLMRFLDAIRI